LLSGEDEALLIGRDAFLILDLGFDGLDSVSAFDVEGDGLASECLDKDLHTTAEAEDEMEGRLLLDVVVSESATVLELLSGKDEALLIGRDAFLVLDLGFDRLDSVSAFDIKSDGLASEGLNEDLHATTETEDEMESRLLLDVVISKGATVLKLLSGEDEALLIGRDAFFVLDLGLDGLDGVGAFDIEGDGLASEGLDEDLHTTAETEDEMEG